MPNGAQLHRCFSRWCEIRGINIRIHARTNHRDTRVSPPEGTLIKGRLLNCIFRSCYRFLIVELCRTERKSPMVSRLQYQVNNLHVVNTSQPVVRLGQSGLKVSKIILGCMQYGDKGWQEWVLEEDEAIEQIKFAFVISCSNSAYPAINQNLDTKPGSNHSIQQMCATFVNALISLTLICSVTGLFQWPV